MNFINQMSGLGSSKFYTYFVIAFLLYASFVSIFSIRIENGLGFFRNVSDSMSPTIKTGSLSVVWPSKYYDVGDIITFYSQIEGQAVVTTHRVVQIGGNAYVTRGDANEAVDRTIVQPRLIIGKVALVIPYIGFILSLAKSGLGLGLTIWLPGVVIILIELVRILNSRKQTEI